jgi:hypothetical protein
MHKQLPQPTKDHPAPHQQGSRSCSVGDPNRWISFQLQHARQCTLLGVFNTITAAAVMVSVHAPTIKRHHASSLATALS